MRQCFLCGRNGSADPLDHHHIFGGAYRKKSERYGLVVDLCHHRCHIFGGYSVHKNAKLMLQLKRYGQLKAILSRKVFCRLPYRQRRGGAREGRVGVGTC